jgi:Spy/CpxP family protein refolding chaperone
MKPFNRNLALSLTLVFLSGLAVGALSYSYYVSKTEASRKDRPPHGPKDFRKAYTKDMEKRLKLSDEQLARLNVILDQTEEKYKTIRGRTRPEMTVIQNDQVAAINAMLTKEQQAEYGKIRKEREERRKRREAEQGKQP